MNFIFRCTFILKVRKDLHLRIYVAESVVKPPLHYNVILTGAAPPACGMGIEGCLKACVAIAAP